MADTIRSAALSIPHAFLDGPQSAAEEFDRVPHAAGPVFVRQVHSPLALRVDAPFQGDPPEADALATATPGLALAIVTADCAPVVLADAHAGVIGAAHAGWRGAHGGVLEAVTEEMVLLGARREAITAAIGPCVAQASYEVDTRFRENFTGADDRFFASGQRDGHWQFDLEAYAANRLQRAGIGRVECLSLDTYALEDRFFSYRRATHRNESRDGRQVSLIALPT